MKEDLKEALARVDTTDWRRIPLEYGHETLEIAVPRESVEISMGMVPHIDDWRREIQRAFSESIGSPKLEEVIKKKGKRPKDMTVSVTVSDITDPFLTRGRKGFSAPYCKPWKPRE